MAEAAAMKMEIDDIAECPVCTEVYSEPKVLPCIHTFCLKCLEGWSKDKKPGDQVSCPLCRNEFTVPDGGLEKLSKNNFVAKLLEVNLIVGNDKPISNNYCDLYSEVKIQMR